MSGCPNCSSSRLKRASFGIIPPRLTVEGKRRYGCLDCGWTGWKHPLQRRSMGGHQARQRRARDRKAVAFAIGALILLIAAAILLFGSIRHDGPGLEVTGPVGQAVTCQRASV